MNDMELKVKWCTDMDDYDESPVDNEMYLVTIKNGNNLSVDFIQFYWGDWCVRDKQDKVVAWCKIEPCIIN